MAFSKKDSNLIPIYSSCASSNRPNFILNSTLAGHNNTVLAIEISNDGELLASGCIEAFIKVWNIENENLIWKLDGHKQAITDLTWSNDKAFLVSASMDKTLRVWDVLAGKCLKVLNGSDSGIFRCTFNPNSFLLASGSFNGAILCWDINTGTQIKRFHAQKSGIIVSIHFNSDGTLLTTCTILHSWNIWDVATEECLVSRESKLGYPISSAQFTPDGYCVVVATFVGILELWEISKKDRQLKFHKLYSIVGDRFLSMFTAPAGEGPWLISISADQHTVNIWNLEKKQMVQKLKCHNDMLTTIAFNPLHGIIASAALGRDKTIKIWKNVIFSKEM